MKARNKRGKAKRIEIVRGEFKVRRLKKSSSKEGEWIGDGFHLPFSTGKPLSTQSAAKELGRIRTWR